MKTSSQPSIEEILVVYSPEVRSLVLKTRALVRKVAPRAAEQVGSRPAIIGFGFSSRYADMIFSIMPNKSGVTLGIARGTELPDPASLLQGAGKVHRHVKIKSKRDPARAEPARSGGPESRALLPAGLKAQKQND